MIRITINAPVTIAYFALAGAAAVAQFFFPINAWLMVHGPVRLGDPGFWLSLLTWTFGHGNLDHLVANFTLLLLLGPLLEERFGSFRLLVMYVLTSVIVGLIHAFLSQDALIGASGTVFMAIMLTALSTGRGGVLPLSFVLIAWLYLGKEVWGMFENDSISQLAHLAGGALGIIYGLVFRRVSRAPISVG